MFSLMASDRRIKGLEVFHGKGSTKPDSPKVTIQAKGVMSFNRASFEALSSPEAVEFLYNAEDRIIGLRRVDPTAGHAYQVRNAGSEQTFNVSATSFLKFHEIPYLRSVRYDAEAVEGILIIDLKQEGADAGRSMAERMAAKYNTGGDA
jgi:hypothetical protein